MTPGGRPIEPTSVPKDDRPTTNVFQRLLEVGRVTLLLLHDALRPGAALDRLARRAVYCQIEELAAGRRVLDLDRRWKHGADYLEEMGAVEVVVGGGTEDSEPFELALAFAPGAS